MLGTASFILAQEPTAPGPKTESTAPPAANFLPYVLVFFAFMMWMVYSGNRQKREQQKLLAALKPGDKVVTSSGIVGKIFAIKEVEGEVIIKTDDDSNTRVRVLRSTVAQVVQPPPEASK